MYVESVTPTEISVSVRGELDLHTAPGLRRAVAAAHAGRDTVRLDLAGVAFMDSAGVHTLADLAAEALGAGKAFRIDNPSPRVRRVVHLTRTAGLLGMA